MNCGMTTSTVSSARSLHRLIYFSRVHRAAAVRIEAEVDGIVAASVRNNSKVGLTGLLLLHDGYFIQALEGAAEQVMTTYGRILNDPRHMDGNVIASGPVPQRAFGAWAMCARRISRTDQAVLDTLATKGSFDPSQFTPAAALRLLEAVAGVKARRAA
jgi:hypothetical protein